jgi:hypothetical protein
MGRGKAGMAEELRRPRTAVGWTLEQVAAQAVAILRVRGSPMSTWHRQPPLGDQMTLVSFTHCGRAIVYTELLKDVHEMGLDCRLAHEELRGRLPIVGAAGNQLDYLQFTRADRIGGRSPGTSHQLTCH